MFKRVTIVALLVAAFVLLVAVPAMAYNGYRADYTISAACEKCHGTTPWANAPIVYPQWALTKHGTDEEAASALRNLPYGSVCAGCHTANYDPRKVTPSPSPSSTTWVYVADPSTVTGFQATGTSAASELDIGCSSCHYGAYPVGESDGVDTNDTAHNAPYGLMADAQICGACHSRYSYTVDTIPVTPAPSAYVKGAWVVNPSPTATIQPQMAIGYPMLGYPTPPPAWSPNLAAYLNVPYPGWDPNNATPSPAATVGGFGKLMTYWQTGVTAGSKAVGAAPTTKWQQIGHDGSAAQYPEWASEGHAAALTDLTSQSFWGFLPEATKQECLECHSADFRIIAEKNASQGKPAPASSTAAYGITCVGCHAPHDAGTIKGVWDEEMDAQLVNNDELDGNGSNLCTECHNGEIPAGSTASPGAEVHHPMKEMMDGYGAIDVAKFPSVHKGKCIQCHMPPTSYSRGSVQKGGNHTFEIIEPEVAAEDVAPIPVATVNATTTAFPLPGAATPATTNVTITTSRVFSRMPYSACSTCHDNNPQAETVIPNTSVTTVATVSPSPAAGYQVVTTTINRDTMIASGDKGLWLQDTIEQRQAWTIDMVGDGSSADAVPVEGQIGDALNAAALRLGYTDKNAAYEALVDKSAADRTESETTYLKAVTNAEYVVSEGSFGIHNWDYSRQIVNTALWEAESVGQQAPPQAWSVAFKASKTSVKKNTKVKYSGSIAPADALAFGHATVTIQKYSGGAWGKWKTVTCNAAGSYAITVKMTKTGTYKFRALMPAFNAHNMLQGNSATVQVKVKK